jgi:hypothetical protein
VSVKIANHVEVPHCQTLYLTTSVWQTMDPSCSTGNLLIVGTKYNVMLLLGWHGHVFLTIFVTLIKILRYAQCSVLYADQTVTIFFVFVHVH